MIRRTRTPSANTGPNGDLIGKGMLHNDCFFGANISTELFFIIPGFFIYIETSHPRKQGDKARLKSPVFPPFIYCLQFAIHAWGDGVGKLKVNARKVRGSTQRKQLLILNGNLGKVWHLARVTVACSSRFVVRYTYL